jgi:phthiodiolone/phenolphthiodiolone dimycocerosates ketoreductase
MPLPLRTAIPFGLDRSWSAELAVQFAQMMESSDAIDQFLAWDQLVSWWPKALWKPENTFMAEVSADPDSFNDAFMLAAIAAASTKNLGVAVSTDAIRRGPAELMQAMLTLAGMTQGNAACLMGAGEIKQCKPFGYKRSQGLARMEDLFRIFPQFFESPDPIDFEGNQWHLKHAWVGSVRPYRPKWWAMGGGPRLTEIATRYGDGFISAIPLVSSSPEQWATKVEDIKRQLEQLGRDPEDFTFGAFFLCALHEDQDVIEKAMSNRMLRWFAAALGRFSPGDWDREGIEPVYPRDWHYAWKLLPDEVTQAELDDVEAKVTREMVEKSLFIGDASSVAKDLTAYADAGANYFIIADMLPFTLNQEEAQAAVGRSLEVCRLLKSA